MNKKVKNLNIEDLLFWDIECVRATDELDPNSVEYELFENKTRNRDTDEVLEYDALRELYKRKGALYFAHNKIVCITVAVVRESVTYIRSFTGTQKTIIEEFCKVLQTPQIPTGYNIIQFDFPLLRVKALQEGINNLIPERFNDAGKKAWNFEEVNKGINILDLMSMMKGTNYASLSLDESCYLAGIKSPKSGIDGSRVSDVYYSGGLDRIVEYCEKDVVACIHLLQKMRGEELTTKIVNREGGQEEVKMEPLKNLYLTKEFSDGIKEDITKRFLAQKKVLKKEWAMLEKLLFDLFYEGRMFKTDTKKVADAKRKEVKEFVEQLQKDFKNK